MRRFRKEFSGYPLAQDLNVVEKDYSLS